MPLLCVKWGMSLKRLAVVMFLAAAVGGACLAQWRHFGDPPQATSSSPKPAEGRATPDSGTPNDAALAREALAAHNSERARVGANPLVWSDQLAAMAKGWAENLLTSGRFEHPARSEYGSNLFEITGSLARPSDVVRDWASESKYYDYTANTCRGVCGHYTQIVWNDTKKVGCAFARGGVRQVWVCEYDPPGNWVGKRPY